MESAVLVVGVAGPAESDAKLAIDMARDHFPAWFGMFCDWVEVLTPQMVRGMSAWHSMAGHESGLESIWVITGGDKSGWNLWASSRQWTRQWIDPPITLAAWRWAIAKTNERTAPPLAHLLLRDARLAWRLEDPLRASLDAATAVELTLTPLLHGIVSDALGSDAADRLAPDNQPIARKIDVLRDGLGNDLPNDLHRAVFKPRNRVIHGGDTPTREEAFAAISAAARVLGTHAPLGPVA